LRASLNTLTGIAPVSFFRPISSRQLCRSVTTLRIHDDQLIGPPDRLQTVANIRLSVLGDDHAGKGGLAGNKGRD
jgi:hypothetical protein